MLRRLSVIQISPKKMLSTFAHFTTLFVSFWVLYGLIVTVANDVPNYVIYWEYAKGNEFLDAWSQVSSTSIGSFYVIWFLSNFSSAMTMIFLIGMIALSIKYYLFTKYLNYGLIAYLLYVLTFVHILDANQIREALALCVVFYAILAPPKSKYTYLFLTSIAILFHYVGVIILTLYFIRRPFLLLILAFIAPLLFDSIVTYSEYFSFATIWLSDGSGRVSLINSFWIMQIGIAILCAFYWDRLSEGQKRGALLNMFGVVIYVAFLNNPIVAHRIRELSQIGIFAILFLGSRSMTAVKFGTSICFGYIIAYNLFLILQELMSIHDVRL